NFAGVWGCLLSLNERLSQVHGNFAKRARDLEAEIREQGENADWKYFKLTEAEILKSAKEIDNLLNSSLKKKGGVKIFRKDKSDQKAAESYAAYENAQNNLRAASFQYLERFQLIDEVRLEFLKEIIASISENEASITKGRETMADDLYAEVLSFETSADIELFCSKASQMKPSDAPSERKSSTSESRRSSIFGRPASPPPPMPANSVMLNPIALNSSEISNYAEREIDSEGFSIPPPSASDWSNQFHESEDDDSSMAPSAKLKVDIKKDSIQEEDVDALKSIVATINIGNPNATIRRKPRRTGDLPVTTESPPLNPFITSTEVVRTSSPTLSVFPDIPFTALPTTPPLSVPTTSPVTPFSAVLQLATSPTPIHIQIIETINILLRNNTIEKALITGELMIEIPTPAAPATPNSTFTLSLTQPEQIIKTVPNSAIARHAVDVNSAHSVEVSMAALTRAAPAAVVVLKYQAKVDTAPFRLAPLWKCGEDGVTDVVVVWEADARLADVQVLVTLAGDGVVGGVQMVPVGAWNNERKAVLWSLGAVEAGTSGRLLARFQADKVGVPSTIAVKFKGEGVVTGVGVEVEGVGVIVDKVVASCVAGTYGAN
ncbi:hypothetical protein HK096_006111, partial [Nowakowskiella sp. JEL0078]